MLDVIPSELLSILRQTPELRESYLVGGCVRDWLMGLPVRDFDVEVFGVSYDQLRRALLRWGRADLVGRAFGVIKLKTRSGTVYDFSLPRLDSKVAPGHKGFAITCVPSLSPREAAARRDFTINALMFHPLREELLDFFGGREDLEARRLRHVGPAFVEDPLRVLRGMQFAGRFDLEAVPETVALCRQIKSGYAELAVERIREEWMKWATESTRPSAGLRFLVETEWIEYYPELDALRRTPQDPLWHPEGDVFTHTCHCCDALARLLEWQQADRATRAVLMFATLTHDLGKATTTQQVANGDRTRIVSPRHDVASVELARRFFARLRMPRAINERVLPLVESHMAHLQEVTDRAARRLARRLQPETIEHLCVLITADAMGRPPLPPRVPEVVPKLRAKAAELAVQASAPKPVLLGRHLRELGMEPGPSFRPILDQAYEAQLDGRIHTLRDAYGWLLENAAQFNLPVEVRNALERRLRKPPKASQDAQASESHSDDPPSM